MKLKGFTLAEILITLSIIGVVSALTLPGLVSNVSTTRVVAALNKAQNTLENANFQYLSNDGAESLLNACHGASYLDCMSSSGYMKMSPAGERVAVYEVGGVATVAGSPLSGYISKDGLAFYPVNGANWRAASNLNRRTEGVNRRFGTSYAPVWVDINGVKGPNTVAKDIFRFDIDAKGEVVPYGGSTYATYNSTNVLWKNNQQNGNSYNGCGPAGKTEPLSCAGSIIDNGKVVYTY